MCPAYLFVAVLGASNYTYAEATASQGLEDWLGAHIRTFEFIEGVVQLVIPDNTRTGVKRACRYEPDINPAYQELAKHYSVGILPPRNCSSEFSRIKQEFSDRLLASIDAFVNKSLTQDTRIRLPIVARSLKPPFRTRAGREDHMASAGRLR